MGQIAVSVAAALVLALIAGSANAGVSGNFTCTAAAPNGNLYTNQGSITQSFFLAISLSPPCTGTPTGSVRIGPPGSSHFFTINDGSSEGFLFSIAPGGILIYSCVGSAGTCGIRAAWSLESTH